MTDDSRTVADDDDVLPPGPYDHVTIEWQASGLRTITVDEDD